MFRFVEYTGQQEQHHGPGDLTLLAELVVPFAEELRGRADLSEIPVQRREDGPEVTETLTVDPDGITSIRIEVHGGKQGPLVVEGSARN